MRLPCNKSIWKTAIRPNTEHLSRVHHQPNRIYSIDGVHPTIPSQETSGRFFIYIPEKKAVRKLTLKECYKIMGFPDDFITHRNLGTCYKQIGNSVCIPLIYQLAINLKQQIFEGGEVKDLSMKATSKETEYVQLKLPGLENFYGS